MTRSPRRLLFCSQTTGPEALGACHPPWLQHVSSRKQQKWTTVNQTKLPESKPYVQTSLVPILTLDKGPKTTTPQVLDLHSFRCFWPFIACQTKQLVIKASWVLPLPPVRQPLGSYRQNALTFPIHLPTPREPKQQKVPYRVCRNTYCGKPDDVNLQKGGMLCPIYFW